MTEESFKGTIVATLLIALFLIAIYNFSSGIINSYDSNLIIDNKQLDLLSLETTMNQTSEDAQSWENTFKSDNPFVATGALIMFGIWGAIKLMWTSVGTIFNIFLGGVHNVLGIPPLVTGIILAVFIIGLIFLAWRAIKSGN